MMQPKQEATAALVGVLDSVQLLNQLEVDWMDTEIARVAG